MEDLIGVYGILDRDHWPEAPFQLLDGGVEIRWKEPYAFHNAERGTYSGWLMQYTLCLLYTSPSPRDRTRSRMPSSA